ncbi:MAG: DUF2764 domain-containing protein [Treponema sp.]|nr:DUF2764 domain-containing protein [Treponema sp.]
MVGSYYYLAAQLPYLIYGQNVPMSSGAFKKLAGEHMDSSAAAVLDHCTLDICPAQSALPDEPGETCPAAPASSSVVSKWKEWERTLRLNLAKNRAKKLKREGGFQAEVPDYPYDAAVAARAALAFESPLEAELYLDKARWDAIEGFQGLDSFSESAIYAYLLKLLLMERRMAFNTEEGYTEYKGLYAAILGEPK